MIFHANAMAKLTNSHSLTDFQRNARDFITDLNSTREPVLITVNGRVQAVLVDPETYENYEELREKARFFEAIREGEQAIAEGKVHSAEDVIRELKAKYGL